MKNMDKRAFKLSEVIVIIVVVALLSAVVTGFVTFHSISRVEGTNYVDLTNDSDLKEFLEVYADLITDYYEEVDRKELIDSAINGMMSSLGESYTTHLSGSDSTDLLNTLSGEYEGIGVQINPDKTIHSVFKDSPAEKAGLLSNDLIIKINNESVESNTASDIATLIKTSKEDTVTVTVMRGEEELNFEVKRSKLEMPSVASEIIEKTKIGYMSISTFSNTTAHQFSTQLNDLEEKKINSLIIDLRGNSGGYLLSAKQIASFFIAPGKVIYSLEDKEGKVDYKDESAEEKKIKVIVLIDSASASASEILAAALKESYGATLVGKTTYGKGKVQQTKELSDGSLVKYTSAKWLTPNGTCVDKVGIKPDYEVELTIKNDVLVDTQLNKAIELLK